MLVRTRYFFVGSALIVAVGLCVGLVAYYGGNLPLRASTIGPAELSYLPSATTGVAYANVRDIMNSEFRRKLSSLLPSGAGKHQLLAETGIDLDEDIDSVVAGIGSSGDSAEPPIVLLRGRFDASRIERVATSHGATAEQHQGRTLLTFSAEGRGAPALAFLEPGLVALGEPAALRRAIDVSLTGSSVAARPEVMRLVADVDGAGNAWVIGRLDDLASRHAVPDQVARALPNVQWVTASFDVGEAVNGRLRATAADEAAGEQLRAVVNGAVAAGRIVSASDPRLAAVLNSVRTGGSGETVEVSFTVPPEMLDLIHPPNSRPVAPDPQ
jgi:hypothetical protein